MRCKKCGLLKTIKDALMMKLEAFVKSSAPSSFPSSSSSSSPSSSAQASALDVPIQKAPATPLVQTLPRQGPLQVITASPWTDLTEPQPLSLSSWSTSSVWSSSPWWSTPTSTWWSTPVSQSWWSSPISTSWW
ncbi:uncharacterized protein LOC112690200 [Sipha flava]|uniref:Uncharacterized protein LOC112690200 n=1 Tax=Sipha flava TaxID=143950 RepID=A0A8B8GBF0_9HEMI|nr:uncharacterized protein LOC112690200 [Sipha flava]